METTSELHEDINKFYKMEDYPLRLKGHNQMNKVLSKINEELADFLKEKGYKKESNEI